MGGRDVQPGPAKFIWPPRPPTIGRADPLQPALGEPPALTGWEAFEREWLGVITPPLARRLADAGAVPDRLDAFCWRCGRTVGPYETDAGGCSNCRGTRPSWDRFVRLAEYGPPWSRIIQDAKFTRWPRLAVDLGAVLGRQVALAAPDLGERPTVVVPVPTSFWRRLSRGTDHSLNIARGVGGELRLPVRTLLSRAHRREQARLPRSDREVNLRGSMRRAPLDAVWSRLGWPAAARWPGAAAAARVVVVDDISTTGATLLEACRAVRKSSKSLNIKDLEIVAACICRTELGR